MRKHDATFLMENQFLTPTEQCGSRFGVCWFPVDCNATLSCEAEDGYRYANELSILVTIIVTRILVTTLPRNLNSSSNRNLTFPHADLESEADNVIPFVFGRT